MLLEFRIYTIVNEWKENKQWVQCVTLVGGCRLKNGEEEEEDTRL